MFVSDSVSGEVSDQTVPVKLTDLCFFQRDEHKYISVASRGDSLIFLACIRDRLGCQQCSNTGLGLGLQSWVVGNMLGCSHVPVEEKAAWDSVNKSTTKSWILLFLGSCCCPHLHTAQVPRSLVSSCQLA